MGQWVRILVEPYKGVPAKVIRQQGSVLTLDVGGDWIVKLHTWEVE